MDTIDRLIDLALDEDIGPGDITTQALIDNQALGQGLLVAKQEMVLAGLDVALRVFKRLDRHTTLVAHYHDGQLVAKNQALATVSGRLQALLQAERSALNFLQRLSGIATLTRQYVKVLQANGCQGTKLVDTRKTTPGWRVLEKYAVKMGGAGNHRLGLFDGILVKDNHIAACGGIAEAVKRLRQSASHLVKIEVETENLKQVRQALEAKVDVIMLDNMDLAQIREAVEMIAGQALVEVSGGVTLDRIVELAKTGVDLISCGALTHSATAVDISMQIKAT